MLPFAPRGPWSFHGNALDRFPHQFEVIDIGAAHGQSDRNALALGEEASLGAGFGSIRGVFPRFFPRPAGPWSWPHPGFATSSSAPSIRRIPQAHHAIVARIRPPSSTLEIAGGPSNSNKSAWRSTHSTDNPCAERRESRPSPRDRFAADDLDPVDRASSPPATMPSQTPITHPNIAIPSIASLHPPF